MALDRAAILALLDRKPVEIKVPEWGEGATVWIRPLSSPERSEWETYIAGARVEQPKAKAMAIIGAARDLLAVLSICDENGERLFSQEDIPALQNKNATALERIGMAAMKLNKLRPTDIADLAKN